MSILNYLTTKRCRRPTAPTHGRALRMRWIRSQLLAARKEY
jgi:hypothetical protein